MASVVRNPTDMMNHVPTVNLGISLPSLSLSLYRRTADLVSGIQVLDIPKR